MNGFRSQSARIYVTWLEMDLYSDKNELPKTETVFIRTINSAVNSLKSNCIKDSLQSGVFIQLGV